MYRKQDLCVSHRDKATNVRTFSQGKLFLHISNNASDSSPNIPTNQDTNSPSDQDTNSPSDQDTNSPTDQDTNSPTNKD